MERFRTCDECSRHVRVSEAKCPFCGHSLEAAALAPFPRAPAQLSRAQRIALIAAVAGSIAGCADESASNKLPGQGVAGAAASASATGGASAAGAAAAGKGATGPGAAGAFATPVYGAPVIPPAKNGGSGGGASGAGASGSGSAGQGAPHGGDSGNAGEAGAAGSAGNHAAAGSGGVMVHPLYGASPAYGLPPTPPPKK